MKTILLVVYLVVLCILVVLYLRLIFSKKIDVSKKRSLPKIAYIEYMQKKYGKSWHEHDEAMDE